MDLKYFVTPLCYALKDQEIISHKHSIFMLVSKEMKMKKGLRNNFLVASYIQYSHNI